MGECCKCGSEEKPGAPPFIYIEKSGMFPWKKLVNPFSPPKLVTNDLKDFQPPTIYSLYEVHDTTEFCGRCPDSTASSFPNKEINYFGYLLYRNVIYQKWIENCQCRSCPSPFKGGQCPTQYWIRGWVYEAPSWAVKYPGLSVDTKGQFTIRGPVKSIGAYWETNRSRVVSPRWIWTCIDARNEKFQGEIFGSENSPPVFRFARVDGLPDECGDITVPPEPPPLPPFTYDPKIIVPPFYPPMIPPPPIAPPPCTCPLPRIVEKERIVYRDREKIVKVPVEKIIKVPVEKIIKVQVEKKVFTPVPIPIPVPVPFPVPTPVAVPCPPRLPCPPKLPCKKCKDPELVSVNIPIFDHCENGTPKFKTLTLKVIKGTEQAISQQFQTIARTYKCEDDVKFTQIKVTLFDHCDNGVAKFKPETISVIQGTEAQVARQFNEMAQIRAKEECSQCQDAIAAVPEWWQVRLGADRPQLVVQYAEVVGMKDGKPKYGAPMYALTIPHYYLPRERTFKELFPAYIKGQAMAVLVLDDNSKLILNCADQDLAESMVEQLSTVINPNIRQNAHLSIGVRQGQKLKGISVYPRIAKFFATGQQNMTPTWVKYFKDDEK